MTTLRCRDPRSFPGDRDRTNVGHSFLECWTFVLGVLDIRFGVLDIRFGMLDIQLWMYVGSNYSYWLDFTNFGWIYVNLVVYEQQRHPRWNIYMNKRILHLQIVIFGVDTARSGAGYLFKDTLKQVQKLMKNMASSSDFVHNRHNQSILVCYLNLSLHYCCSSYQMYFILWLHVTARQTENGLKHCLMNWDTTYLDGS